MSFRDTIRGKIGSDCYRRLDIEAQKEVALAKQMALQGKFYEDQYYSPRLLLRELQADSVRFQKGGLQILPVEIVWVLFRCKLLRAAQTEKEFQQRCGMSGLFANRPTFPQWTDRTAPLDVVEDQYVSALEDDILERILLSPINALSQHADVARQQAFLEDLFRALDVPFVSFLETDLIEKHKLYESGLRTYDSEGATRFFSAPSLGYRIVGTRDFCFWHGVAWLRTFLNMLRIAGFIYAGQIDFFLNAKMMPPTYPVFLGSHATGSLQWHEDRKESWDKLPDGSLFRSWGFRGISNMVLDIRNFNQVRQFMVGHKCIFEQLQAPWSNMSTKEVAPILDILSSATQIPDLGAKLLLIYCCLEHLFVPPRVGAENSKYIIGGLNALKPRLRSWFDDLYDQRNQYAHKGFVLRNEKTLTLIRDSVQNVMTLLAAKLSIP
jgi:hypothetical protein